jgi:hypothetical protein
MWNIKKSRTRDKSKKKTKIIVKIESKALISISIEVKISLILWSKVINHYYLYVRDISFTVIFNSNTVLSAISV